MAWTTEDEDELNSLKKARDDLATKIEGMGKDKPLSPYGIAAAGLRKATESIDIAANVKETAKAIPPAVTSGVTAEYGARLGTKLGAKLPGPWKVPGMIIGNIGGRLGGAALGAVPGEVAVSALDDEALDYDRLFSSAQEQVAGEVASMGIAGVSGRGLVRKVQNVEMDPASKATAQYMSEEFRKTYNMLTPERRAELGIDPEMAGKVIKMGGMTAAQSRNSRILDLVHGSASGSIVGGGTINEFKRHGDVLSREVATAIGEDVGDKLSQADLGQAIRASAKGELKIRRDAATPWLNQLREAGKTVRIDTRTMDWGNLPNLKKWEGTNSWSINQYAQTRRQLTAMIADPRTQPAVHEEATKALRRLDSRARRSLPANAQYALKQMQDIERGIQDDFLTQGFIVGMLRKEGSPRRFVQSLVNNPDHVDLKNLLKIIPDVDVQDNLRRELVHRTFKDSLTQGGGMSGARLRRNINEVVGAKTLDEIVGKDTRKRMEKLADYREHLEGLKGRGEAGRVATGLTQWTMGGSALGAALSGKFGATLGLGLAMLGGPGYAAKLMTDPRTARQLTQMYKLAANGNLTRVKANDYFRKLAPKVMDNKVVERVLGHGMVEAYDQMTDPDVKKYFDDATAADNAVPPEPVTTPPAAGGAPGGAFVEGPQQ